jgi:hypothetical protein
MAEAVNIHTLRCVHQNTAEVISLVVVCAQSVSQSNGWSKAVPHEAMTLLPGNRLCPAEHAERMTVWFKRVFFCGSFNAPLSFKAKSGNFIARFSDRKNKGTNQEQVEIKQVNSCILKGCECLESASFLIK